MKNIYEVQEENKRKSLIVIIFFSIFIAVSAYYISMALGYYLGYEPGGLGFLGIALIISSLVSFSSYWFSDQIILLMSNAKPADKSEYFDYYTVVENLCLATGLPMPKLYIIDDTAPNAFATGRGPQNAVICATTGLLQKLNRTEIEGVIGHELSHIRNYDMLLMTIVSVLVGSIALLADFLLRINWSSRRESNERRGNLGAIFLFLGIIFAILSPVIANLIKLAISRRREFMADAGSVSITKQPSGLISALKKISQDHEPLEVANKATAHLYIVNPFKDKSQSMVGWFANLFNTHPPIEERLKLLEEMA